MNSNYVPILKWKRGEQQALKNLSEVVKSHICPLFEISNAKKELFFDVLQDVWPNRGYYFYFTPECYEYDVEAFPQFAAETFPQFCNNGFGIPVIDLSYTDFIDNWNPFSQNGVALRLRNNEFGAIENTLNGLFDNGLLSRDTTDIIMDLQLVSENDLFAKTAVLKAAFSDLDSPSAFRSIIISSSSFKVIPENVPEIKRIYRFKRTETEIFSTSSKLSKQNRFNFHYVYSDYGPTDIEDTQFVIGMSPNFKIKYTGFEDYLYIKGISLKKGGLDIANVRELANLLITDRDYSGSDFSWGDQKIYDIATGHGTSPGNLTTWVSYAMNHHMTFIISQI